MKVRVAIPHFIREIQGGGGYGSGRIGAQLPRSIALGRCLSALLALRRSPAETELRHSSRSIGRIPALPDPDQRVERIELDIHVWTNGADLLKDVLALYADRISIHAVQLDNPKLLPIHTRDWLIQQEPIADLSIYMEEDIVISDPLFLDKQLWFLERTDHKAVLMPHRFEPHPSDGEARFLVDGPLPERLICRFHTPRKNVASGCFRTDLEPVSFDQPFNPHSGCFVVDAEQIRYLRQQTLPQDGFVSPLETAATLTVLQHFLTLKPSEGHQRFLMVEHGHPSFLSCLESFPRD